MAKSKPKKAGAFRLILICEEVQSKERARTLEMEILETFPNAAEARKEFRALRDEIFEDEDDDENPNEDDDEET